MAALRSPRRALRRSSPWTWLLASVLVWVMPLVLGVVVLIVAFAIGRLTGAYGLESPGGTFSVGLFVVGYTLFFSPTLSWVGLLLALPVVALLLHTGFAGWASFAVLGLLAGGAAGGLISGFSTFMGPVFGVLAALGFRWIFSRLEPEIFTIR